MENFEEFTLDDLLEDEDNERYCPCCGENTRKDGQCENCDI